MITGNHRQCRTSFVQGACQLLLLFSLGASADAMAGHVQSPATTNAPLQLAQVTPPQPLRVDELWRPELRRIPKGEEWVPKSDAPQFNSDPFKGTFAIPATAKIADGISFSFDERRLRLKGITSFAPREICRDTKGQRLACGALARAKLAEQIYSGSLFCLTQGKTEDGIEIVDCPISREETVQQLLVREGWAVPTNRGDTAFSSAITQRCKQGNDRSQTQRLC
jgi:endonuclease YncB( thermonuclease family)